MRSPEVSRFITRIMLAGRSAVGRSFQANVLLQEYIAAVRAWGKTEDRLRAAGVAASGLDDLPQWVFDLAETYGVEHGTAG